MKLNELKCIVTGAASGMGRHFVLRLVEHGATVAAVDISAEALNALAEELASGPGKMVPFTGDVSKEADVERIVAQAYDAMGGLNALVNNAGIFRDALLVKVAKDSGEIKKMSLAQWQQVIDVDLTGPFLFTREFAAKVIETKTPSAVVTNISSVSRAGNPGQSNYSAAKAGLVADTKLWAQELARYGIRVNAIAPGFVDTPILQGMRPEALDKMLSGVPMRRTGSPEEIFLGLKFAIECDYFTGRCLDIDGGLHM
ncbi:MAG: SDR family oxidoreductase [Myxococcota bacterium]|jgi:3-oxoacyl-[acyl-carrier protein] reductase|nr:SDR family oxidoreductase [Myxococcota bacterium]